MNCKTCIGDFTDLIVEMPRFLSNPPQSEILKEIGRRLQERETIQNGLPIKSGISKNQFEKMIKSVKKVTEKLRY